MSKHRLITGVRRDADVVTSGELAPPVTLTPAESSAISAALAADDHAEVTRITAAARARQCEAPKAAPAAPYRQPAPTRAKCETAPAERKTESKRVDSDETRAIEARRVQLANAWRPADRARVEERARVIAAPTISTAWVGFERDQRAFAISEIARIDGDDPETFHNRGDVYVATLVINAWSRDDARKARKGKNR